MATKLKPQREGTLHGPVLIGASEAFKSLRVHIYLQELISLANECERLKNYQKQQRPKKYAVMYPSV